MTLDHELKTLHLRHPFILSGSQYSEKQVILVRLFHDGAEGWGESSPSRYYGEPPESVLAMISQAAILLKNHDPSDARKIDRLLRASFPSQASARNAVMTAVCDWNAKRLGKPLYRFFEAGSEAALTSFTIGMDEPEILKKKIEAASEFPILKIKLGDGDRDYAIMENVRSLTDKKLRVDANEGWTYEEAKAKIAWLAGQNVELVEQPLPSDRIDDMKKLKALSSLPLFADESVKILPDIDTIVGAFDGINIKLDKCGGPLEALDMIRSARARGLKVMLGCMVQTSVGTSAAAHLSPLVDFADLDGHLLITDDAFTGLDIRKGRIYLSERPGLGVSRAR